MIKTIFGILVFYFLYNVLLFVVACVFDYIHSESLEK